MWGKSRGNKMEWRKQSRRAEGGSRVHDGSPEKFDGRFSVTEPEEREETKFFVGFQR